MRTTELCFPGFDAAGERGSIRWALFQHPAVIDVRLTARSDTLQIEHRGAPEIPVWAATLLDAGFPAPRVVVPAASTSAGARQRTSA